MNAATEQAQTFSAPAPNEVKDEDKAAQAVNGDAEQPEAGNIDKIREIIFGGQMRDYDQRFQLLEDRLVQESVELREEHRRRLDALEVFVKRELDALYDRLQTEQKSREESVQGVTRSLADARQVLEGKLIEHEGNQARSHRDLREQLLEQSKTLLDEIHQKHEDISSALGREVAGLSNDKTSRSDLASLFGELAVRLNGDLKKD